jgi:TM2 domain-containing membrane protein YozV
MESQKVDMYLLSYNNFFESKHIPFIRDRLLEMDDNQWGLLQSIRMHDPYMVLLVSALCGFFGIDRFIIGDVGLGLGKLFTCGGFGIWAVIDMMIIMNRVREINGQSIQKAAVVTKKQQGFDEDAQRF